MDQNWFPTPEIPGEEASHIPIQKRILSELRALQKLKQLNPVDDRKSRQQFLSNFHWKDSMPNQQEIANIEELLVEFHNIFARHRFDIEMTE